MLILVGVTINVALNGGLFTQAQSAAEETQIEADREQLLSAVVGAIGTDAKVNFSKLDSNLPNGWTGSNGTYTSPNGNTFTVDENGTITDEKGNGGGTGGIEQPTEAWKDNGNGTYTKGEETVEIGQIFTNAEVQEKLGVTGGTYIGTWTIIGVEENKLKLVSTENVRDDVILGYDDPNAIEKVPLEEGEELTETIKLERGAWSYILAEETLNTVAKETTGIKSARSIIVEDIEELAGIQDSDKGDEYEEEVHYYFNTDRNEVCYKYKKVGSDSWSSERETGLESLTLINTNGEFVAIESKDDELTLISTGYEYELTEEQKEKISCLNSPGYWFASKGFIDRASERYFCIQIYLKLGIDNIPLTAGPGSEPDSGPAGCRAIIFI